MDALKSTKIVIAGIGNYYRCDDGAGPQIADEVAEITNIDNIGPISEPLDLIEQFEGVKLAILIDAMKSGEPPGTIRIFDVDLLSDTKQLTSTHGIGLGRTLQLADALGKSPEKVIVVGIEGKVFGDGNQLSPEVREAIPDAVKIIDQFILSQS
ncbi:MAG: hydrogenase maturation protease [Firmicutes bacterium]|jgi:hydrogenase maturation protease|nr:hydrogenase maturation protease [Bacillota bacterium]